MGIPKKLEEAAKLKKAAPAPKAKAKAEPKAKTKAEPKSKAKTKAKTEEKPTKQVAPNREQSEAARKKRAEAIARTVMGQEQDPNARPPIRGRVHDRIPVEPPITKYGTKLNELEADVNKAREAQGLPPISYLGTDQNVSRLRLREKMGRPDRHGRVASGGEVVADQGTGHGRSSLKNAEQSGTFREGIFGEPQPWSIKGSVLQQKTALESFMDTILRQKSDSRKSTTALKYDPASGQRLPPFEGNTRNSSSKDESLRGETTSALINALYDEDPSFGVELSRQFNELDEDQKGIVLQRIAEAYPRRDWVEGKGGGRRTMGFSDYAQELVTALETGEINPTRMQEIEAVTPLESPTMSSRQVDDTLDSATGQKGAYTEDADSEIEATSFDRIRDEYMGGGNWDNWAPTDPGVEVGRSWSLDDEQFKALLSPGGDRFLKRRLHGEKGSQVEKSIDDLTTTRMVNADRLAEPDPRAYRQMLEQKAIEALTTGNELNGGAPSGSPMSRYFETHVKNMAVDDILKLLEEKGVEVPQKSGFFAEPEVLSTGPVPVREIGEIDDETLKARLTPKTYAQLKKAESGGKIDKDAASELTQMYQNYTSQEQYDLNLEQLFNSPDENIRRHALQKVWEKMQSENGRKMALHPAAEHSGIGGGSMDEKLDNFLALAYSHASPGQMDKLANTSKGNFSQVRELARDHYFTEGRPPRVINQKELDASLKAEAARKQSMEPAGVRQAKKPRKKQELALGEQEEEVSAIGDSRPVIEQDADAARLSADKEEKNRRAAAEKKAKQTYANDPAGYEAWKNKTVTEYGPQDSVSAESYFQKQLDAAWNSQVAALFPPGTTPTPEQLARAEKMVQLRGRARDGGPVPQGVPVGATQSPSGQWMMNPYGAVQKMSPEEYAAAKPKLANLKKQAALESNNKALQKELAALEKRVLAYERSNSVTAAEPMPDKLDAAAASDVDEAPKGRGKKSVPKAPPPGKVSMAPRPEKLPEVGEVVPEEQPKPGRKRKTAAPKAAPQASTADVGAMLDDLDSSAAEADVPVADTPPAPAASPAVADTPVTPDRHGPMMTIAAKADRTPEETDALFAYLKELQDSGETGKDKWDEIHTAFRRPKGDATPEVAPEKAPEPAPESSPAPEEKPASKPEEEVGSTSESDDTLDPLEQGATDLGGDGPEETGLTVPKESGLSGGAHVPDDYSWQMEPPHEKDPVVWYDDYTDYTVTQHPKDSAGQLIVPPKKKPKPQPQATPDVQEPPKKPFPWKKVLAGAAVAAGGGIALDYMGRQPWKVDPFGPGQGGGSGAGGGSDITSGPEGGGVGPMSDSEAASKPFHQMSAGERIRFLARRSNEPTPDTLTRAY